jgi:hypothetical protein
MDRSPDARRPRKPHSQEWLCYFFRALKSRADPKTLYSTAEAVPYKDLQLPHRL